jgi:site-specific DNA-methyltransferase (adenine-specific)
VGELDRQSGERRSGSPIGGDEKSTPGGGRVYGGGYERIPGTVYPDSGGASRFFYCAKAATAERSIGLEWSQADWPGEILGYHGRPRSRLADRWVECDNHHPTVKALDLCRYLATLILPPPREDGSPRRLLIPFSGSGSEAIGALLAGWDEVVCIENDPVSVEVSRCRIAWWEERIRETGASDPQTIIEWGRERPAPEARFWVSGPLFTKPAP